MLSVDHQVLNDSGPLLNSNVPCDFETNGLGEIVLRKTSAREKKKSRSCLDAAFSSIVLRTELDRRSGQKKLEQY